MSDALSYPAMTFIFDSCIFVVRRTCEERRGREGTGFGDDFAALGAGSFVAKELLLLFRREFANRR
ncbi:MAG TPA: hypothetical protein VFI45_02685 [Candidatus Acidoferrum sp.]|nr:hypothetical protein [Candidatus Acidoferrum sp.]